MQFVQRHNPDIYRLGSTKDSCCLSASKRCRSNYSCAGALWTNGAYKANTRGLNKIEGQSKCGFDFPSGASVALAAGFSATAAFADGYQPRAAYALPPSWTGFYAGIHAGGAWSDVEWSNVTFTGERFNNNESGFIGGGQVGYNQQFGNIVLGVEATISGGDLSRDFRSILVPTTRFTADLHTVATVTGRFGLASEQWLFYGKAGWATARAEFSGRDTVLVDSFSFDDWRNGWTAGRSRIQNRSQHEPCGGVQLY
jgi:outer membrane immunogenic protein